MSIETEIFRRCRLDEGRCLAYGFRREGGDWRLERTFLDGAFRAVLTVDAAGQVTWQVIDTMTEEEYLPLRQTNPAGSYVFGVRHAYEELLREIAAACFSELPFAASQTNRLCQRIQAVWGDAPEFPWSKPAYADSGIFRHPATRKWYAAILPVAWDKVVPGRTGRVELLDIKVSDAAAQVAAYDGCYPAYHMNKKYWLSIALDDSMTDDEIWPLLEESHAFAAQGKKRRAAGTAAAGKGQMAQGTPSSTRKVLTDDLAQEVLAVVAQIPAGKVATYGQIARLIGRSKNARLVGKILSRAEYYGTYPCHRVVNHVGRLAPGFASQKERLQAEGVTFKDESHVAMRQCQWIIQS